MEITIENNHLVPVVYIGFVWISLKSFSELNKVLAEKNSSYLLIGLNFTATVSSFTFLAGLTRAILKPGFAKN